MYDREIYRMTRVDDGAEDRASRANDTYCKALGAMAQHDRGIDPSDGKPYSWPTCEKCGERTNDVSDTERGVLCWDCLDGERQADADRAYDYERDTRMEDGR